MACIQPNIRPYDVIIYGATGFTGRYIVREALEHFQLQLSWGIAGRNRDKLESLHREFSLPECVAVISANYEDRNSIVEMCTKTRVLINCVGPYQLYGGELVVSVCVEFGCDYVDVSGEVLFIEKIRAKFGEKARENGVFIIPACGVDCVPADLGVIFAKNSFAPAQISHIHSYLELQNVKRFNYGTWHTLVETLSRNRRPNKKLDLDTGRERLHYNYSLRKWCLPFKNVDVSCVNYTQSEMAKLESRAQLTYTLYLSVKNIFWTVLIMIWTSIIFFISKLCFGKYLLLKHPRLFSFGVFSHVEPTENELKRARFRFIHECVLATGNIRNRVVEVSGHEPGYVTTSAICIQCVLTLLEERNGIVTSIGVHGGVLTPGLAFENTDLIQRLNRTGKINFADRNS